MEEDEEIQSHPSPESEPHSPPSGRITVTVAAAAPTPSSTPIAIATVAPTTAAPTTTTPPPSHHNSLTLALPIQNPFRPPSATAITAVSGGVSGGGGGGGGREDCWSEGATSVLIDAWGERYMELSRGNLKQKHWKEVADIVSSREDYTKAPKTDIQCKNRIDTVKKKYKVEKAKVVGGGGPSLWPFFDRLDRLIGPHSAVAASAAKAVTADSPGQKAVPVGIPVGIRHHHQPMPLPGLPHYLQTPPHLQQQLPQQQQQMRHHQQLQQQHHPNNFASPLFHKFNSNSHSHTHTHTNTTSNVTNASKQLQLQHQQQHQHQQLFRRGPMMPIPMPPPESDSDPEEGWSPDSTDSFPPETTFERRKRPRVELNSSGPGGGMMNRGKSGRGGREKAAGAGAGRREKAAMGVWGNSVRELTRAILKFGEAYEAAESAKLQQIVEMEKQRMKFAKELELQRMKFLMKTQLELSQLNSNGNTNSDSRGGGGGGSSGRRGGGVGVGGGGGGGESNHHHHENHVNHAHSDSSN